MIISVVGGSKEEVGAVTPNAQDAVRMWMRLFVNLGGL